MIKYLLLINIFLMLSISNICAQGRYDYKNKGYFNLSGLNYYEVNRMSEDFLENGAGNMVYNYEPGHIRGIGVQSINGWFIGPYISMGVGFGYDFYNKQSLSIFPIFYDLRIYFSNDYDSFFLYGDIGTIISKKHTEYASRALFTAGVGYKFFIGKNCFEASIGLDGKSFTKTGYDLQNPVHAFTINSISIGLGILF